MYTEITLIPSASMKCFWSEFFGAVEGKRVSQLRAPLAAWNDLTRGGEDPVTRTGFPRSDNARIVPGEMKRMNEKQ